MRSEYSISTVETPAASYNLIDLATLKTLLGVTNSASDDYFNLVIPQASAAATKFMNNVLVVETIQDQFWPARDGAPWIVRGDVNVAQLTRWPLITVTSVVETIAGVATTLVAGTDFLADGKRGQLIRLDSFGRPRDWRPNPLVVVYSAGYATIPADAAEAVSNMIKQRWYAQTRDPQIRQRTVVGVMETAYWFGSGPGSDTDMAPTIQAALERYRVPVIS